MTPYTTTFTEHDTKIDTGISIYQSIS